MPNAKVRPDVISCGAAISACEKGGQRQEVLKLVEAMSAANCHRLRSRHQRAVARKIEAF